VLHYDADWDREIERLKELPARKCVLELDGKTDIFRAKKILAGHMCILGDVHPALLTLGTVDEVKAYCKRLLDGDRPRRLHHGPGLRASRRTPSSRTSRHGRLGAAGSSGRPGRP
jgi:uroporphyrinogen-III decarboxylase